MNLKKIFLFIIIFLTTTKLFAVEEINRENQMNFFTNITNAVQDLLPPEITIGTSNRYRDNHELKYSFRSLFKYAPWIRQVFLVTSGHIPNWLNTKHPKMTVVTHSDLWKNKTRHADPKDLGQTRR